MAGFLHAKSRNRQARTQMMCSLDIRIRNPFHRDILKLVPSGSRLATFEDPVAVKSYSNSYKNNMIRFRKSFIKKTHHKIINKSSFCRDEIH